MKKSGWQRIGYVSLHTHMTFSILDSHGLPEQYVKRAKELGQTAIVITEHDNTADGQVPGTKGYIHKGQGDIQSSFTDKPPVPEDRQRCPGGDTGSIEADVG